MIPFAYHKNSQELSLKANNWNDKIYLMEELDAYIEREIN